MMFKHLDAYKLKFIAIIAMLMNHMVVTWWELIPVRLALPLFAVGGLAFPIMAYFAVDGYRHTSNLKKYILRLFIVGLIAIPFHIFAIGMRLGSMYPVLNIMFSIILALIVLVLYDKIKRRAIFWLIYLLVIVPGVTIFFEWYFIGTTMALLFYIIPNETARRIVPPIFAGVCWFVLTLLSGTIMSNVEGIYGLIADPDFTTAVMPSFFAGCVLATLFLKNYNGERGKKAKWLFYIFYPLHLAVLAIVALALGLINF